MTVYIIQDIHIHIHIYIYVSCCICIYTLYCVFIHVLGSGEGGGKPPFPKSHLRLRACFWAQLSSARQLRHGARRAAAQGIDADAKVGLGCVACALVPTLPKDPCSCMKWLPYPEFGATIVILDSLG